MSYNPRLDVLRAIAAVSVLGMHYSVWFGWGWMGVPLFFVLSGFLITSILLDGREHASNLGAFTAAFFVRRLLRLWPAYALFLGVWLVVYLATHKPPDFPGDLPYLLTYTFNLAMEWRPVNHMFAHLWSLSVEWQFYLAWPFLVWFLPRPWARRLLVALVVAAPLLRFFSARWLERRGVPADAAGGEIYLLTWTHLDALALGALLAWKDIRDFCASRLFVAASSAALLGAGLFVAVLGGVEGRWDLGETVRTLGFRFGLNAYGEYVWGFSLMALAFAGIVAAASRAVPVGAPAGGRGTWLPYLGRVSYGFYIFHLPVVHVVTRAFDRVGAGLPAGSAGSAVWSHLSPPLGFVVCFAVTFLLAHASYQLWERRFLRLQRRFSPA